MVAVEHSRACLAGLYVCVHRARLMGVPGVIFLNTGVPRAAGFNCIRLGKQVKGGPLRRVSHIGLSS